MALPRQAITEQTYAVLQGLRSQRLLLGDEKHTGAVRAEAMKTACPCGQHAGPCGWFHAVFECPALDVERKHLTLCAQTKEQAITGGGAAATWSMLRWALEEREQTEKGGRASRLVTDANGRLAPRKQIQPGTDEAKEMRAALGGALPGSEVRAGEESQQG